MKKKSKLPQKNSGDIVFTPALQIVERLAGSVQIPRRFKKLSIDEMLKKAKEEYFHQKHHTK